MAKREKERETERMRGREEEMERDEKRKKKQISYKNKARQIKDPIKFSIQLNNSNKCPEQRRNSEL